MFNYRRAASKVGGFALSALLSGAVNILTIPFIVSSVGPEAWGAIATGQAAGAIGSVLVQMGWGVTGPTQVAKARTRLERTAIYRESVSFRSMVLPPVLVAVFALSWFVVAREFALAAAIAGVGAALFGMSASWFLVGLGAPLKLLFLDTLPRSFSIVMGALVVTQLGDPIAFSSFILVSSLLPFILSSVVILRGSGSLSGSISPTRSIGSIFSDQWPGVTTALISTSYKQLPLLCIAALAPSYAPAYAVVDRVLKFAIAGIRPASQAIQGWIPKGPASALQDRVTFASRIAFCIGAVSGLGFLAFGPLVTSVIGSDQIQVGWALIIPAAVALGMGTVSQTTGMACLTARGQTRSVAASAAAGASVCLLCIWPMVLSQGAEGAMWSVVLAETTVLAIQIRALRNGR